MCLSRGRRDVAGQTAHTVRNRGRREADFAGRPLQPPSRSRFIRKPSPDVENIKPILKTNQRFKNQTTKREASPNAERRHPQRGIGVSPQSRAALFDPPTDPAAIVRDYTFSSPRKFGAPQQSSRDTRSAHVKERPGQAGQVFGSGTLCGRRVRQPALSQPAILELGVSARFVQNRTLSREG